MAGLDLDDLTEMAEDAAAAHGHDLGPWEAVSGEEAVARRAVCLRCGRVAYVRSEAGMAGTSGDALTQGCS